MLKPRRAFRNINEEVEKLKDSIMEGLSEKGILNELQAHFVCDVAGMIQESDIDILKPHKELNQSDAYELAKQTALQFLVKHNLIHTLKAAQNEYPSQMELNENSAEVGRKLKIQDDSLWVHEIVEDWNKRREEMQKKSKKNFKKHITQRLEHLSDEEPPKVEDVTDIHVQHVESHDDTQQDEKEFAEEEIIENQPRIEQRQEDNNPAKRDDNTEFASGEDDSDIIGEEIPVQTKESPEPKDEEELINDFEDFDVKKEEIANEAGENQFITDEESPPPLNISINSVKSNTEEDNQYSKEEAIVQPADKTTQQVEAQYNPEEEYSYEEEIIPVKTIVKSINESELLEQNIPPGAIIEYEYEYSEEEEEIKEIEEEVKIQKKAPPVVETIESIDDEFMPEEDSPPPVISKSTKKTPLKPLPKTIPIDDDFINELSSDNSPKPIRKAITPRKHISSGSDLDLDLDDSDNTPKKKPSRSPARATKARKPSNSSSELEIFSDDEPKKTKKTTKPKKVVSNDNDIDFDDDDDFVAKPTKNVKKPVSKPLKSTKKPSNNSDSFDLDF